MSARGKKNQKPTTTLTVDIPEFRPEEVPNLASGTTADRFKWGNYEGTAAIRTALIDAHKIITTWKNNVFILPRNSIGKDVIKEMTRLLKLFNNKTPLESIAIYKLVVFLPLMLQKPHKESKNREHNQYLQKRMQWWKEGKLPQLVSECSEIQRRLKSSKQKEEAAIKGFTRLMLIGKVRQALKLVDSDSKVTGVHVMNDEIRANLQEKHPHPEPAQAHVLDNSQIPEVEEVVFEEINFRSVQNAAKDMDGSGGPTKIDADTWKHLLCSRVYGKLSEELADEIAVLAKRICKENIPSDYLKLLWECRLVALRKDDNGVRPVGIGETLRRIVGKCVNKALGNDVQLAAGALQTCAGMESGVEAAIHAMSTIFEEDQCEAVLLVDAENAFNRLNREVALHNIQRTCPPLFRYLHNSYKQPAKLHLGDGTFIFSEEGVTQGDNVAMAMYSVSSRKLIDSSRSAVKEVKQVWFADDSCGGSKIAKLRDWWNHLKDTGPAYGYFPKPSKTWLIIKSEEMLVAARQAFAGTGVQITASGERHIGAALGSPEFKEKYVKDKVDKWVADVMKLSEIAQEEPQAALSAYNTGLSQRWKFVQRTIRDISHLFDPLEDAIRQHLIPSLIGREVSDLERRIIALPYRYGGMGILNPTQTSDREYEASKAITAQLSTMIYHQQMDMSELDRETMEQTKLERRAVKEQWFRNEHEQISDVLNEKSKRLLEAAQEKGASAWLSALPIKRLGYVVNKQEFRDAVSLRYGWTIPDMPKTCGCGKQNSIDHLLMCSKGGYTIMRHNALRDCEAKLLREVCRDVKTEPALIPTVSEMMSGNIADRARADVSAIGVWSGSERTFVDVMVTHPTGQTNMTKPLNRVYKDCERKKKCDYNQRIIDVERGTFTPLIYTTTGGMGPECSRFNKRVAELIAEKRNEQYHEVIRHVRTSLRFALLRATLVAVRGIRGRDSSGGCDELDEISYNIVPHHIAYEA